MNYLVIDTEFTVRNWTKGQGGDPFDPRNKLCLVGTKLHIEGKPCLKDSENEWNQKDIFKIEYDDEPFGEALIELQNLIESVDTLVLFNAKRDLHWLRRYGIRFSHRAIWDVQYAHFVRTDQSNQYPSLNMVCVAYGHPEKLDFIEEKYWSKKIDTDEIPLDELCTYLDMDVDITERCFLSQLSSISDKQQRLIRLGCKDLLILEEMEWNGILYDIQQSLRMAEEVREDIADLDAALWNASGGVSINWNSDQQLSAVLYGGTIEQKTRVDDGVYKTGKKAGLPKYRWEYSTITFPRLVNPLEGSELKPNKDGGKIWSVAEPVLAQLKAYGKAKRIISILQQRAKLEKLVSSYLEGLPKLCSSMGWGSTIHGTLNQCVAITGRLSSSKPNLQNNDKKIEKLFRSRF